MKELLLKHGFSPTSIPNEFMKGGRYKAIVWNILNGDKVTICLYSPNVHRLLDTSTYNSKTELEKDLKQNHPFF